MYDAFASFPDTARLWLMAFPRPLDEGEKAKLAEGFEAFLPHWKTHSTSIESAWMLLEDQIFAVVENTMGTSPSGCSIDAMLRQSIKLASILELPFLDAQSIVVRAAGKLRVVAKTELEALLQAGTLDANTPVIDLGLLELGPLRSGNLERPLAKTWIARKYRALLESRVG
ncbi:MAG: hypothetical protein IPP78_13875 [Holophagaceae bacterium]|nr:hypothetical protein [Holophagaceae bacterium]